MSLHRGHPHLHLPSLCHCRLARERACTFKPRLVCVGHEQRSLFVCILQQKHRSFTNFARVTSASFKPKMTLLLVVGSIGSPVRRYITPQLSFSGVCNHCHFLYLADCIDAAKISFCLVYLRAPLVRLENMPTSIV